MEEELRLLDEKEACDIGGDYGFQPTSATYQLPSGVHSPVDIRFSAPSPAKRNQLIEKVTTGALGPKLRKLNRK